MKHALKRIFILVGVITLALTACSKRDRVIDVGADDAEMNAAIAKARKMLPHFWQVLEKPERGESDFALKVKITDNNGTEHFWTIDIDKSGGKIMGTINNDPNVVETVKLGTRMEIPEADISDWMYVRDEKMIGNYTIVPLFREMSDDQVKHFKSIMADP